jgi:hypothetical protein
MEFISLDVPNVGEGKPFVLMPIGDIQWTGRNGGTAEDLLKRRIDKGLELNARFIGLGDYTDAFSPSNRQRLRSAALYDTAEDVIDQKAMELVHELFDRFLRPTKGRWISLHEGHHFAQLKDGTTTDMLMAELLATEFVGTCSYTRLAFKKFGDFNIWAHHGCGGGMRSAAPINKLETLANYWDANLFLMGHMTKLASAPLNRVYPNWSGKAPHLQHRKIMLVGCGGFSKAYIEGARQGRVPRDGYVAQKLLNPASLGSPIIRVYPRLVKRETHPGVFQQVYEPELSVEI